MKPHQNALVGWFDKYCIGMDGVSDDSSSSSSNFSGEADLAGGVEENPTP